MRIIETCLPVVYCDIDNRLSVEKGLNLCRISEVWGCAVHIDDDVVFLSKVSGPNVLRKKFYRMSRATIDDLLNKFTEQQPKMFGVIIKPQLMDNKVWQGIAENYVLVNATMEILRRHGVVADNLYAGQYIVRAPKGIPLALSSFLDTADQYADKDEAVHMRFGIVSHCHNRSKSKTKERERNSSSQKVNSNSSRRFKI